MNESGKFQEGYYRVAIMFCVSHWEGGGFPKIRKSSWISGEGPTFTLEIRTSGTSIK